MLPKRAKVILRKKESAPHYINRVRKKVEQMDKAVDKEPMPANKGKDNTEPIPVGSAFSPRKSRVKIRMKRDNTASYRTAYDTMDGYPNVSF